MYTYQTFNPFHWGKKKEKKKIWITKANFVMMEAPEYNTYVGGRE